MGRAEGENGSFLAIRIKINQKISSSMNPRGPKKKHKKGPEAMPKFLIVMCMCGIFARLLLLYCRALIGCPDVLVSKNKKIIRDLVILVTLACHLREYRSSLIFLVCLPL